MFGSQVVAAVVAATVQLGVQSWMFTHIPDMCAADQKDGFICPQTQVFGTASIIWGVIGPRRQFKIYPGLQYAFLVGALCPLIAWCVQRRWPRTGRFLRYVHFPVIFNGLSYIPPASAVNYATWAAVAFVFNYAIRRRKPMWWTRYNCEWPWVPMLDPSVLTEHGTVAAGDRHLVCRT